MTGIDSSDFCSKELELPSFWMWHVFAKDSNEQIRKLWDLGFSVHWVWKYLRSCIFLSLSAQLALTPYPLWVSVTFGSPLTSLISLCFLLADSPCYFHSYNYSHGTIFFLVCSQYSHSSQTSVLFHVYNSLNGISILSFTRAQSLWLTLPFPRLPPSRDINSRSWFILGQDGP